MLNPLFETRPSIRIGSFSLLLQQEQDAKRAVFFLGLDDYFSDDDRTASSGGVFFIQDDSKTPLQNASPRVSFPENAVEYYDCPTPSRVSSTSSSAARFSRKVLARVMAKPSLLPRPKSVLRPPVPSSLVPTAPRLRPSSL
ncbi:hypothetical protein BASA81_007828 [Batrachochytrium salamandrivorans]|nr:hypothetical protein BASA81_007828 [Batrachochytrium salamandrivorans]